MRPSARPIRAVRRLASPVSGLTGIGLVTFVAGAASGAILARYFGPAGRGQIAAVIAWIGIVTATTSVGLDQAFVFHAAKPATRVGLARRALQVSFVQATISAVLVAGLALALLPEESALLGVGLAIWLIPVSMVSAQQAILHGMRRWSAYNGTRLALVVPQLCASGAVAVFGLSLNAYGLTTAGIFTVVALIATGVLTTRDAGIEWSRRPTALDKSLVSYGLRAWPGNVLWIITARLDQVVLYAAVSPDSLGYYAVAVSVSSLLGPVTGALSAVSFANTAATEDCHIPFRVVIVPTLRWIAVCAFALAALAPLVIPVVYGATFAASVFPTVILVAANSLLGLGNVASDYLRGTDRPGRVMAGQFAGAAATVVLAVLLIPRHGATGAAITSFGAYGVTFSVLLLVISRGSPPTRVRGNGGSG